MNKLIPQIISIAKLAGQAIMEVYADSANTAMTKTDNSPLTQADLASDRVVSEGLEKLRLGWPVLSEESTQINFDQRKSWKRFWLVDPLDGTKEFVKRNGEFTVNIALIESGVPILGVVYAPVLDVCYYGVHGASAFKIVGSSVPHLIAVKQHIAGEAIKVVASRSHSDAHTQALLAKMGDYDCISMGSSLKLCLVAEGTAHFYPRLGPTMEWDTAAAHAVVSAAGGVVNDSEGNELTYNKTDLHNPEFFVFASLDKELQKLIKDFNE